MGICLDTDKKNEPEGLNGRLAWHTEVHPVENHIAEGGHVKFVTPNIPVIFVLGGPGSGKVTHCDSLSEEKRGIVHINVTDLLQQHSLSNDDIKDFNQLSSRIVAETLMLEMKMSPAAKTILISGYPRNMRDVVEYTSKIKTVSGVILLAWNENNLERQIEYGAKLGHIVLSLARMELNNFYKNVIPVADYYDQRKVLVTINGERSPQEVYNEFRVAVLRIISSREANDAPVSSVTPNIEHLSSESKNSVISSNIEPPSVAAVASNTIAVSVHDPPVSGYPTVVYVLGGPGSNKAYLIRKVLRRIKQWSHVSMGELLRGAVDSRQFHVEVLENIRNTIAAGQMVDDKIVAQLLDQALTMNINSSGIILDGYPRSMSQLEMFEKKYDQHPRAILLDCSKLQLSRGRWDDSVAAFRKRLEVFRESTLPMLKVLDTEHRLMMVDGDTDTPEVQEQFTIDLLETIDHAQEDYIAQHGETSRPTAEVNFEATILQDLEDEILDTIGAPTPLPNFKSQANGYGPPRDHPKTNTITGAKM